MELTNGTVVGSRFFVMIFTGTRIAGLMMVKFFHKPNGAIENINNHAKRICFVIFLFINIRSVHNSFNQNGSQIVQPGTNKKTCTFVINYHTKVQVLSGNL